MIAGGVLCQVRRSPLAISRRAQLGGRKRLHYQEFQKSGDPTVEPFRPRRPSGRACSWKSSCRFDLPGTELHIAGKSRQVTPVDGVRLLAENSPEGKKLVNPVGISAVTDLPEFDESGFGFLLCRVGSYWFPEPDWQSVPLRFVVWSADQLLSVR